jgi:hypothetical protein
MLENSKGARKMNGQSRDSCKVGHRHTTKTKQKQKQKTKNKERFMEVRFRQVSLYMYIPLQYLPQCSVWSKYTILYSPQFTAVTFHVSLHCVSDPTIQAIHAKLDTDTQRRQNKNKNKKRKTKKTKTITPPIK